MRRVHFVLALLLLTVALPLHGQWKGRLESTTHFGWMPKQANDEYSQSLLRASGSGALWVGYKSPKFLWNARLDGGYERLDTDTERLSMTGVTQEDKPLWMEGSIRFGQTQTVNLNFNTDMRWTPGPDRWYEPWMQVRMKVDNAANTTYKENGNVETGAEEFLDNVGLYIENPYVLTGKVAAGLRTSHWLGVTPRRTLKGIFSIEENLVQKESNWLMYENKQESEALKIYRLTPSSDDVQANLTVHYIDSLVTQGPWRLTIDPGLRLMGNYAQDRNSGATLVDPDKDEWKDSTNLREKFNFLALRVEPYFAADFSWSKLRAHIDYAPQLYFRRLTDDVHQQELQRSRPYPVGSCWVSWTFSPAHKITLRNTLAVKHPGYLQICWYERQGNYLTQLYRGKEDLRATQTRTYGLDYEFTYKRFRSITKLSFSRRVDEVDQTYSNEEIDGRMYKVFTWVNASDSWMSGITEQLGWRGKVLEANIGVTYNGTRRQHRETGQVKTTTDWRAWADAKLKLSQGWALQADANYHSDVATFFTLFKQYCALNVRVEKKFKKVKLFLEGRDLLDGGSVTQFASADQNEMWEEISRKNRRRAVLGFHWDF